MLPFAGAAQTRGPFHLTMDTNDTIETARAFPDAVIVPVHTDGWAHFRQNANDLRATFDTLGFGPRLRILEPGVATVIEPSHVARLMACGLSADGGVGQGRGPEPAPVRFVVAAAGPGMADHNKSNPKHHASTGAGQRKPARRLSPPSRFASAMRSRRSAPA